MTWRDFIDRVTIHAAGGDGGNGVASIKREKFASPDLTAATAVTAAVILEVDPQVTTLLSYHRSPHQRAHRVQAEWGTSARARTVKTLSFRFPMDG